ncbi:MAG: sensor histidine kinase, partial [Cytophagia bacterium]
KKNNFLHIKVEDNGQGIEKELQNRIFEMYFRGSEHSQGNGLGLYVVHRAVYQLKGFVEFESEVASGSIFEVYLPYS